MATTRKGWAGHLCDEYGLPRSLHRMTAIIAWETAEGTEARYNPLATTWDMPGSTDFNRVGVKDYLSLEDGLVATKKTLSQSGYGYDVIVEELKINASAHDILQAVANSSWGTGSLALAILPDVRNHLDYYGSKLIGQ